MKNIKQVNSLQEAIDTTTEEVLKDVIAKINNWFTLAPKYRTKVRLLQEITDKHES